MSDFLRVKAVRDCVLFQDIPHNLIEKVLQQAKLKEFPKPTKIMVEGEPCLGMHVIVSGHADVSITSRCGTQSNLIRAGVSDVLGDPETITKQPCLATCETEAKCSTLFWSVDNAKIFIQEPVMAQRLMQLSYNRISVINNIRSLEHGSTVDLQIADCLLRMSIHDPIITQSQSFIAEAVGCSRQTVNRILGQLRDAEIISLRKSKIEVHEREKLAKFFEHAKNT